MGRWGGPTIISILYEKICFQLKNFWKKKKARAQILARECEFVYLLMGEALQVQTSLLRILQSRCVQLCTSRHMSQTEDLLGAVKESLELLD